MVVLLNNGLYHHKYEKKVVFLFAFALFCLNLQAIKGKAGLMSSRECLSKFTPNLFWDADPSLLSMDASPAYIIQRVLEYGQMNDWLLINQYYGLDRIVEECKQLRTLDPVCLSFITTISHTKEEDYRCYHFRQFCPTPWNS